MLNKFKVYATILICGITSALVSDINVKEEKEPVKVSHNISSVEQIKKADIIDVKDIMLEALQKYKPTEVEKKKSEKKVNEKDVYRLAQLIYSENGISCDECKLLTGIVVMKRVKSKYYPNTIEGVISQRGQYAVYINGTIDCKPDNSCLNIARDILKNELEKNYPDGLVYQSEFLQGSSLYFNCGNQYFCLL